MSTLTILCSSSIPSGCSLQVLPQQIIFLHLTPSLSLTPTNFMSSFTTSINLLFGLPLGLLPDSSNLITHLPIYSLSRLCTCPNHLSLAKKCNMCCVSDILIPGPTHPRHSKRESQHLTSATSDSAAFSLSLKPNLIKFYREKETFKT